MKVLQVAYVPGGGDQKLAVDTARPELVFEGAKARVFVILQAGLSEAKVVLRHLETFRERAGKVNPKFLG